MSYRRLWLIFILVIVISFAVLGYFGYEIYMKAPPIPQKAETETGTILFTGQDIKDGQNVWQSIGGQEVGTVWGHGSYIAPDWSADWLHKEAVFILNYWSNKDFGMKYESLNDEQKAELEARLKDFIRKNTYNPETKKLIIPELYAEAVKSNSDFYSGLFMNDAKLNWLRDDYAIRTNSIKDPERMRKLNAFFFWTAWATVTDRPGDNISYTNNWPHESLVGNEPGTSLYVWSIFSFIFLLAGIGWLGFYYAKNRKEEDNTLLVPATDPFINLVPFPSMKATLKYFWVVVGLIFIQVVMGIVTAHFGVEGEGFYGIPLAKVLPYSITRTWHLQLAIFWIATSWLATGLYIAPAISAKEPKFQRFGVNFLFIALLVIVLGSLAGQWFGIMQKLGLVTNFWFGHQGYEYIDLGRFWQLFLFLGLLIWLFLMVRAILPAFRNQKETRSLLGMFLISSVAIALFYGAGLMWGRQTNLSIAEYWRWWVVHLWVEGFFEVFATVVITFLFVTMGLIQKRTATLSVLFTTIIYLSGGIIGTFHHLYFTGTPTAVVALGASFSALEVVPLIFAGYEAWANYKTSKATNWIAEYKWPIYCFIAVAFWNLVGAGLFGFLINPPISLYFVQGLNTTPVHGHTALFGVYGMLGIGLMLFVMRTVTAGKPWKDGAIKWSFWLINIGLILMVLISLLPLGIAQAFASIKYGLWYARSAEFLHEPVLVTIRWLRVIGDTIFAIGTVLLVWFVIGLKAGWSLKKID